MNTRLATVFVLLALSLTTAAAHAQPSIPWYTVDGGGGTSTGAGFALTGTVGQHDAGETALGGTFGISGGFWVASTTSACPADFNQSGAVTVQDIFDFLSAYFLIAPSADFNQSGAITVQDIFDFLNAYFIGC